MKAVESLRRRALGERLPTVFQGFHAEFKESFIKKRTHLASTGKFNTVIILLIFFNTIIIGFEVDNQDGAAGGGGYLISEILFAGAFLFELFARLHRDGWDYFDDTWNVFDYSLVVVSLADIVMSVATLPDAAGSSGKGMQLAKSLRVFRLLRVVRSIKGLKILSGLWLIIQGLLESMRTVFWVGCAVLVLTYTFAVSLCTFSAHEKEQIDAWHLTATYTGSVPKAMLTIVQVFTFDSWSEVARPLMDVSPYAGPIILACIVILAFGTLNILVGVMVQQISLLAQDSKETSTKALERTEMALLQSILEDFLKGDKKKNGEIEFREFKKLIRTSSLNSKMLLLGIRTEEAESLFDLLDADKSGTLTAVEFIEGLQKIKGSAKGMDVVQLICFAQKQCIRATRFVERIKALNYRTDEIQMRLNSVVTGLAVELHDRHEGEQRNEVTKKEAAQRDAVIAVLDRNRMHQYPKNVGDDESEPGMSLDDEAGLF
eukprot:TRINITY_DN78194_c0_g1_i1.p1 TRINITY_DN78194_c0_g1~~TRINITY_DN78194_c0_g1_i1.p1  ORF type:complete len:488 (+),score=88.47 TRINITY_DN78194_c0_g1_i1:124-1587(+)